ncbi:MAG: class E sortase [Actinomycetia bacterium]|nr:class E sortase [Actinomycetes bacterium]
MSESPDISALREKLREGRHKPPPGRRPGPPPDRYAPRHNPASEVVVPVWARRLGRLGRGMIASGVLILLFVGYQLWGTGLAEARAQDTLSSKFEDRRALLADFLDPSTVETGPPPTTSASTGPTTTTTAPLARPGTTPTTVSALPLLSPEAVDALYPADGEVLGRLFIPSIGVDKFFVEGTSVGDLKKGPGHYRAAPLPGQEGNASIAGHRTTWGQPFHDIDKLQPGDEIIVETLQGVFTYRVAAQGDGQGGEVGYHIVSPNQVEVLDDFNDNRLTLTACHPKFSARQRIIVVAELVGEPALAVPRPTEETIAADEDQLGVDEPEQDTGTTDTTESGGGADNDDEPAGTEIATNESVTAALDLDEGLGWDRSSLPTAVLWGMVAGAIWFATWWVSRRWQGWRRAAPYGVGVPVFFFALWFCFVNLDKFLPAY